MRRCVGLVTALGDDQLAAVQGPEGPLHGAPGEAGLLGDLVMAEARLFRPFARHASPKEEIHDEGGGTVVMSDEVAEEHVNDVAIEVEDSHCYPFNYYSRPEAPLRARQCVA